MTYPRRDSRTVSMGGAGVVVTGAGHGIGAALVRMFAAEGAHVVVNDRHPERARAVAEETGGIALAGDATEPLVRAARKALLERSADIDIYCANAGRSTFGGPELPDADWEAEWDVNVMAHVRAARSLLPRRLERGNGRFAAVSSAAGLLSKAGAAPYAVTKHASLAFAEWLSLTYRHRGVDVHAICPRGVRTPMHEQGGNSAAIEPGEVAGALLKGIFEGRFLILPHPEVAEYARERAENHERWLHDISALQREQAPGGRPC